MAYELIETIEVGAGGAASIEFTSIPQDGVDLLLVVAARNTGNAGTLQYRFNSDSTAGAYSWIRLKGNGTTASSASPSSSAYLGFMNRSTHTANTFSSSQLYISNYSGSEIKNISIEDLFENNATAAEMELNALEWDNTSAITSITISPQQFSLAEYSIASLYKIY